MGSFGIFIDLILPTTLVNTVSNRNKDQGYLLGVTAAGV